MPDRTVKRYDRPFPPYWEIIVPEPGREWPKEVWAQDMSDSEVALFCQHFKMGGPWGVDGPINQNDETVEIFPDIEAAGFRAKEIVKARPVVVCELKNKNNEILKVVRNTRELNKFGIAAMVGLLLQVAVVTLIGVAVCWLLSLLEPLRFLSPKRLIASGHTILLLLGSMLIALALLVIKIQLTITRRVRKIHYNFTAEDRQLEEEVHRLSRSSSREDREKAREQLKQFQSRVSARLKK